MTFLGVDGGGTKTAFCLVGGDGNILAQMQTDSCHYFSQGIEIVERVLSEGVSAICRRAALSPDDISYAFFGIPTYGECSNDVRILDAAPHLALGHDRYSCDNDMVCGWAGSLAAADGINVIAGTGSMTYGENAGRKVRVGGWGELFGDEGSGYWIAVQGLNVFSRMSDGRLPVGPLHGLIKQRLDLGEDLDLVDVILNRWQGERSNVAALSKVVVTAAEHGDPIAIEILSQAARELADLVDVTRLGLCFGVDQTVPVSYSGGVFNAGPPILDTFRTELAARFGGYELCNPLYPPATGAAIYAAKLNGTPLDATALRCMQAISNSPSLGDNDEQQ